MQQGRSLRFSKHSTYLQTLAPDPQSNKSFLESFLRNDLDRFPYGTSFLQTINVNETDRDETGVVARTLPVLLGRPFPDRLDGVDAAQIK